MKCNFPLSKCIFLLVSALVLMTSCYSSGDDDTDPDLPPIDYKSGVYVVNQGSEQNTNINGTLTFYDRENERDVQSVFLTENNGLGLGNRVHSMSVFNDKAFIVVTNTRKVEVVTLNTFEYLGSISNLDLPKFILPINNNKAYVSQWGADGGTGSIQVIDLTTNAIVKTIPTRPGPEKMVRKGEFVYVCNTGGFFLDSVITKINVLTDEVVKTIEVGLSPHRLEFDRNDDLWVITRGFKNATEERDGKLALIRNDAVVQSLTVSSGAGNMVMNNARNRLYYTMQGGVFQHTIDQISIGQVPYIDFPYTALGIDPQTDHLYASDAVNFVSNGEVDIFDASGQEVNSFSVGVIPIDFWFQ